MENPADSSSALGVEPATSSRTGDAEQSVLEEPKDAVAKTEQSRDEGIEQKAHDLMDRITSARSAPNPRLLHALASLLEQEEARFMLESGHSSPSNARSSHDIGRLGNLLRENDEFFELVSSKFLSDTRYTIGVSAAAARLLLACPSTSMYPLDFEDDVLENIKRWALEDMVKSSGEECHPKLEAAGQQASDAEMLKTYATGLLALALNGNGPVVEDVLTCGLSAKLMRFLRIRVLGETSANQKDITLGHESRQATGSSIRAREDIKGRMRHVADATRPDFSRLGEEALPEDQNADKDIEKVITMKEKCAEECPEDGEELKRMKDTVDMPDEGTGMLHAEDDNLEQTAEDKRRRKEWREGKSKLGGNKPFRDEDVDENARDDPSKRRAERGCSRYRGKARVADGVAEAEKCMASPGTGIRFGSRTNKDRITSKQDPSLDFKNRQEDKISELGHIITDTDENDDTDKDCRVGTKDISEMVKRARRAAEAEARAANAPHEAVKAAGDAAAELVKSAATEVLSNTNDEDAAIAAASNAATAVEDAALSTEVSRKGHNVTDEGIHVMDNKFEKESEPEGNFVLDSESLASLREQFSIQCLERLGEYVEVLGPVLHEKGIDVCLALLQRESKTDDSSKSLPILSDLLKLICALAAHRKFAALFVDRGGIQKLLVVPRVSQTFTGISMCLFAIGSLQGVMERICALPFDVVQAVVELALQLLECSQDQARKHAALFFGAAFVFRAVLDAFDAKDGLQKMLNLLRNAANVRAGVSSGASGTSSITSPRNDRATAEVLTAAEKQIAYHTSVALRQYFRAHLLLLVDTLRPNKSHRGGARNAPSARAAYKPIDTSNEAIEAVIVQLQRDRKLGPAFVRARWPAVEKFLSCNGHTILLELSQAPPGERYLHELALFALGVLHIVTLVPNARRLIVGATLSNERLGMAVILDAASGATYGDPEQVIHSALLVLVNLVCPPPSLSSKPVPALQGQNALSSQVPNGPLLEGRERNVDKTTAERTVPLTGQNETRERNGDPNYNGERNGIVALSYPPGSSHVAAPSSTPTLVGDRRISLGPGAGCAGLAAYMEQGYRQAREAVRANNGIKVLLHLLHPRTLLNPSNLDSIRALACRVLLGLAKDDTIAHILTKLQVGKMLSELVRDTGSQMVGASCEQGKWQAELSQVAMELIAIATNAGRASTLAATDAAAPTLRRIERAAIAAATPITYHSKELLQLIHEHLVASGLQNSAEILLKEAQLAPLPSLAVPHSLPQRVSVQDSSGVPFQWPSGRVPGGFLSDPSKLLVREDDSVNKCDPSFGSSRKKALTFSLNLTANVKTPQAIQPSTNNVAGTKDTRHTRGSTKAHDSCSTPTPRANSEAADLFKSPNTMPMKRKTVDRDITVPLSKRLAITDPGSSSPICMTPNVRKSILSVEIDGFYATPSSVQRDKVDDITCSVTPGGGQVPSYSSQPGLLADPQSGNNERATLDSLVVQYLKHQHRQCPAPITTLPPLSLLHPHVCPEPSRALAAPFNTAGRLSTREFRTQYGGMHGHRRDRQFVFSRFRPLRTCRDDPGLLTSVTFLGSSTRIATGSHAGELKIFDTTSGNVLESHACHQSPITLVQCTSREIGNWSTPGSHLLLSSCNYDVRLWDSSAVANGQLHIFDNCRAARFNHTGSMFAAISSESSRREVLLYDVQSCNLEQRLSDSSSVSSGPIRVHTQSLVHFSPSDAMLLWNGVLWDHRVSRPVHRFDQFTDYGGGGFHPAGNEVIINSEVWDLRKFRLLRSVPSLDQTVINFNSTGDIIYATLRRNVEDVMSALNTRRARHPLFAAFRTMDAVHYSDIATTVVDRCVLDLATEPTDSLIGLVAIDDSDAMDSSARIYEVGRRRPTDDDSDPDDGLETEEEDDGDSEADEDVGEDGLDVDVESDMDISNEDDDSIDEGEDGDFDSNEDEDGVGGGILRIISDDEGSQAMGSFSSDEDGSLGEFDEEFMIL